MAMLVFTAILRANLETAIEDLRVAVWEAERAWEEEDRIDRACGIARKITRRRPIPPSVVITL